MKASAKAQLHGVLPPEVYSEETSPASPMSGMIQKKNPYGIWQPRYFYLINGYLAYAKKKGKEVKGVVDLSDTAEVKCSNEKGGLDIITTNGHVLAVKCSSHEEAQLWVECIKQRKQWISDMERRRAEAEELIESNKIRLSTKKLQAVRRRSSSGMMNTSSGNINSKSIANNNFLIVKEGWLMKKFERKVLGASFHERYCRIEGSTFKYFRSDAEKDTQISQKIMRLDAAFIRPYDDSEDCRVFEIGNDKALYYFKAETHNEMTDWIKALRDVKDQIKLSNEAIREAEIVLDTPILIRLMDEKGEDALVECVVEELEEFYPSKDHNMTLNDHLRCCAEVVEYLKDCIRDTKRCIDGTRGDRLDVLGVAMVLINIALEDRLKRFFGSIEDNDDANRNSSNSSNSKNENNTNNDNDNDDNDNDNNNDNNRNSNSNSSSGSNNSHNDNDLQPCNTDDTTTTITTTTTTTATTATTTTKAIDLSIAEMYSLIQFIGKYQKILKAIYCPATEFMRGRNPLRNDLFEKLPELCTKYESECAGTLRIHSIGVWECFTVEPIEMINTHLDGTLFTNNPTDIWRGLNQHLSLATDATTSILHVLVADRIVDVMNALTKLATNYILDLDTIIDLDMKSEKMKENELELLCALANDTALHLEEVVTMVQSFTLPEIRNHMDNLYENVGDNLLFSGQKCLERLSSLVMVDIRECLVDIWTDGWVTNEEPVIESIIITVKDYLSDLTTFLNPFWSEKILKLIASSIAVEYVQAVLKRSYDARHKIGSPTSKVMSVFNKMMSKKDLKRDCDLSAEALDRISKDIEELRVYLYGLMECMEDDDDGGGDSDVPNNNNTNSTTTSYDTENKTTRMINNDILAIVDDLHDLFSITSLDEIYELACERIQIYPSSASSIADMVIKIVTIRSSEFSESDVESLQVQLEPTLDQAAILADVRDTEGVIEGWLGKLYYELAPALGGGAKGRTVLKRLKELAKKPNSINIVKKLAVNNDDFTSDRINRRLSKRIRPSSRRSGGGRVSATQIHNDAIRKKMELVDTVTELVEDQNERDRVEQQELLQLQQKQEKEKMKLLKNVLNQEGQMEKKSNSTSLWQLRYFKLSTRTIDTEVSNPNHHIDSKDDENEAVDDYQDIFSTKKKSAPIITTTSSSNNSTTTEIRHIYTLSWYRKKGGTLGNSIKNVNQQLLGLSLLHSPRSIVFDIETKELSISERTSVNGRVLSSRRKKPVLCMSDDVSAGVDKNQYCFQINFKNDDDEADDNEDKSDESRSRTRTLSVDINTTRFIQLKTSHVDVMMKWVTVLIQAGDLLFDINSGSWVKAGIKRASVARKLVAAETTAMPGMNMLSLGQSYIQGNRGKR